MNKQSENNRNIHVSDSQGTVYMENNCSFLAKPQKHTGTFPWSHIPKSSFIWPWSLSLLDITYSINQLH